MLGKWTGTYKYLSKRLPENLRNRETKFEIDIIEFDGNYFTGIVQDDLSTGGMRGTGKITGVVKNGRMKFIKEMPIQSVYLPDGTRIEQDKPHRKIYYTGKFRGDYIKGIWKFKFGIGIIKNRLAIFPRSIGSWEMKKNVL